MIFAEKLSNARVVWYLPENAPMFHDNCPKNNFPDFWGEVGGTCPRSPVSYAYVFWVTESCRFGFRIRVSSQSLQSKIEVSRKSVQASKGMDKSKLWSIMVSPLLTHDIRDKHWFRSGSKQENCGRDLAVASGAVYMGWVVSSRLSLNWCILMSSLGVRMS